MGLSAISLFSGAGGLDLAAKRCGIKTVCYVEWDRYAQAVLMSRMRDGSLDDAPLWDDVTTFDGKPWRGKVDIVFGGFPCQPHSLSGKRRGGADERNLWPDTMRILRESGAWGFVGENVPGIVTNGFAAQVLADLEREGFCGTPFSNTACAVGAPHMRERVFFVAVSHGLARAEKNKTALPCREKGGTRDNDFGLRWEQMARPDWEIHPSWVVGSIDGLPGRVDRARCCGNGVVPDEAVPAFQKLLGWIK